MKQNIMKKWVKALRSGKYKQGKHTLKQYNSKGQAQHCCLGVLCELYNQEMKKNKKKTLPEEVFTYDGNFPYGFVRFGDQDNILPRKVMEWAGMITPIGQLPCDLKFYDLTDYNDEGIKFKTISDTIEENWEVL